MARVIGKAFFDRPTLDVARELLGKQLCRRLDSGKMIASPRVGVDYAGAEWAAMPWRFVWKPVCRHTPQK